MLKIKNKTLIFVWFVFVLVMPLASSADQKASPSGPALSLEITDVTPSSIERNKDFTVGVQIQNFGQDDAKDVTIEIKNAEPDIQLKEEKIIQVENICRYGCKKFLTYHMHTSPDASPGKHELEAEVTWQTSPGMSTKISKKFTITVRSNPADLDVAYVKTDPILPKINEEMTLTVRIENFGDGEANSVKAKINLPFFGIKEAFLGTLEPDDDNPAVFTLIPDKGGTFNYTLLINYKDDYGEHIVSENLELVVKENKDFKSVVKENKENGTLKIIIVIGIIVLIFIGSYFYFKRKKMK